jgi:hypothetical protein
LPAVGYFKFNAEFKVTLASFRNKRAATLFDTWREGELENGADGSSRLKLATSMKETKEWFYLDIAEVITKMDNEDKKDGFVTSHSKI